MLDTKYNHIEVEKDKYENWKEKGYFLSGDKTKTPFTMVLPPPNVTGNLHLGHAWDVTLQDIMARYKRMDGYDVLWVPGTDHAAIATESKVVAKLKNEGINKYELGREKFLDECWKWTKEYGGNIHKQWAMMGISLDYTKERFTLDEVSVNAVNKVFIEMYNKGLIYKGKRIINWDPEAKTALSNEEVIYKDIKGAFYHIKYYLEDSLEYLDVATTRPETLFGDTAVAVNPKDERYNKLIGKNVIVPIANRVIPIVGDMHADMDKGTGVVKITPAHDPNDFEVGNGHNLERIVVMDETAHMNENAGKYKGYDRFECREALVKELQDKELLIEIEDIVHSVGHSERSGAMVEPYLSEQWFVKMKPLSEEVLKMQSDKNTKVNFYPNRYNKILNQKAEECYDWCISRQLWWGIRIPIWYKDDEVRASVTSPGEGWVQDPDVLDTWFSSGLWPFSTLHYFDDDNSMAKRYFPTSLLTTAYDILFFWVFRMMFQSKYSTNQRPFKDCLIHGLIRAKDGRKMSKSLGNGVLPQEVIEKYGCDSLRYFLSTSSAPGLDLRYDEEKVKSSWNFINKIWNASRFTLMNIENVKEYDFSNLTLSDKWILTRLNKTIKEVRKNMDKYEFQNVGTELYNFIWNDFCDGYIEFSKFNMDNDSTKSTLLYTLTNILKLLHPFMPFVTEEIYNMLPIKEAESIMISSYPVENKKFNFDDTIKLMDEVRNFITKARITKKENNIPKEFKYSLECNNFEAEKIIKDMLKLNDTTSDDNYSKVSIQSDTNVLKANLTYYYVVSEEKLNVQKEALEKEKKTLESNIARREKLLSNPGYVNNAPKNLVDEEKTKLENEKRELEIVISKLNS